MAKDDDLLKDAQEAWGHASECDRENRDEAEKDIRFSRLEEQWDPEDREAREAEGRPCLTVNRLAPIIRQVVNDSRQNKPAIKVMPQDSGADRDTAAIISGLIRNIEAASDADIAYDTAVEDAVTSGRGYFRVNLAYSCNDTWDQDIVFERVSNPLSVLEDPDARSADGSDWTFAFVSDLIQRKTFKRMYPDADPIHWEGEDEMPDSWAEGDNIRVAEYWTRERSTHQIVLLSDDRVVPLKDVEDQLEQLHAQGVTVVGSPRDVMTYKVRQHMLTGAQVLSSTDWAGKWIPIVPVYGDEVNVNGKRYFRSLIRSAKDAQRIFNWNNSLAAELGALAPKVPFIGPEEAFEIDKKKWDTSNKTSHAYIRYKGDQAPQLQQRLGPPVDAMQQAVTASGWISQTTGIYDASLGAPSNERSGKAILARQREGDVSTFHFIDNLSRSIRHGGRIVIDLIPKVYSQERVVRVLGEEGDDRMVQVNKATPVMDENGQPQVDPQTSQPITRIYDLTTGKYDLTVTAGPSFSTRREEAATQMIEFIRSFPAAAPLIGDILARNLDWPGADEIERRLKSQIDGAKDSEIKEVVAALQAQLTAVNGQLEALKQDKTIEAQKVAIEAYEAETGRAKAVIGNKGLGMDQASIEMTVRKVIAELMNSPDVSERAAPNAPSPSPLLAPGPNGSGQPPFGYPGSQGAV